MPQQFVQNPMDRFQSERLPVGWPWRFLMFSFLTFLVSILVYIGLAFGYKPFLAGQIEKKDAEILAQAASISKENQEKLIQVYSQMINIRSLLDGHVFPAGVLTMLEQKTHPKVFFTSADLKSAERELELEGLAATFSALSEQLEIFSKTPNIEKYSLNNSQQSGDQVQFKITLKFGNGILNP